MDQLKYYLAFAKFRKIGPVRFNLLYRYFPNLEMAWNGSLTDLQEAGWPENLAQEFIINRRDISPEKELELLKQAGVKAIGVHDPLYPKLLKQISQPPFVLFYKGDLNNLHDNALAIVGARRPTSYGEQVTQKIISELSGQEIIIVSGLALGIDSLAHEEALRNKLTTVAVLGSGLDNANIFPSNNRYLAEKIVANNGLLISEFCIGTPALKHHFPQRNRIISGLCQGTLLIEAGENSGSLITASCALEQNREVFSVPGSIFSLVSQGTNTLIKKGAKLVQGAADILEELHLSHIKELRAVKQALPDSCEEATVLKHLSSEPRHINELVRLTCFSTSQLNSLLSIMEIKGLIRNMGNMMYIKKI